LMINLSILIIMRFLAIIFHTTLQEFIMLLAELGAPINDLMKKINETWRRL
jgi:hypothetical protein